MTYLYIGKRLQSLVSTRNAPAIKVNQQPAININNALAFNLNQREYFFDETDKIQHPSRH